ncbi:MAG: hypothetical protein U1E61_12780 [Bradyrhizobium sp.]
MSTLDDEEKARNRAIAQNEQHRKAASAVRVSGWAVFIALFVAMIVIGIIWAWTRR